MSWIVVISVFIVLVAGLFWILQIHSDRTYRPSREQVRVILESTMDDSIDFVTFDEFCCVRIAYDTQLEGIRQRFNEVVDDLNFRDEPKPDQQFGNISTNGKRELELLLEVLDAKTT